MDKFSNIIILCIGTNKLIGDSIGPVVGQKLARVLKDKQNIKIYGNKKENLNLKNAKQMIQQIKNIQSKSFIITIDAALGPKEMIERVLMTKGNIKIGEALGKGIEYFSDINIKGIVGEDYKNTRKNLSELDRVERKCIHRLSNQITYQVYQMIETINCV